MVNLADLPPERGLAVPSEPIPIRPGEQREVRPVGAGVSTLIEDGLSIVFADIEAEFELLDFGRDSSDDPTAMVTLYRKQAQGRTFVHRARLLLFGSNARPTWVRNLKGRTARWPFDVDWLFALEQVAALAKEYLEVGEPLIDLWTLEPPASTPFLFDPLLPFNEVTLLYGSGGTLKSYLALLLGIAVATGTAVPVWGRPTRTGPILYCDWETNPMTHARRLRAICAGLGIGRSAPGQLVYRRMKAPIHTVSGQLRRLIRENGFVLVVIDSAGMSTGGNVNAPDDVVRTMDAISTLGECTKLLIGHKNKAGDFIGNVYWFNQSRAVWEVNAEQVSRTSHRVAYLNTKQNDDGLADPLALAVDFESGRITFEAIDPGTVAAARARLRGIDKLRIAITELVDEGAAVTLETAAKRAEIENLASARTYMSQLEKAGVVRRSGEAPGRGRPQTYRLVGRPDPQVALPDDADREEDEDDGGIQPLPF